MLRINTNIAAFNSLRQARSADLGLSKSLERLSSGLRINRGSDDAAGLEISETMNAQVRGNNEASRNIQDGISLSNQADGALNEITAVLQRMNTLAVQASNGTLTTADMGATQAEFSALQAEIGDISANTAFNGLSFFTGVAGAFATGTFLTPGTPIGAAVGTTTIALTGPPGYSPSALNFQTLTAQSAPTTVPGPPIVTTTYPPQTLTAGTDYTITQTLAGYNGTTPLYNYSAVVDNTKLLNPGTWTVTASSNMTYPTSTLPLPVVIQDGANNGQNQTINIPQMNTGVMGVGGGVNLSSQLSAMSAIASVQTALAYVSAARASIGASTNTLEHTMATVNLEAQNIGAAQSRIRDTDMASEMTTFSRQQILTQSSMQMLSFANHGTDMIKQLLG